MATLVKTKRRIHSISATRKITKAMELVASVKFKREKNMMSSGSTYVDEVREILSLVLPFIKQSDDEKMINKGKRAFVIINSNLGLCSSYNNDVYRYVSSLIKKDDLIIPIGLKGFNHFKNLGYEIDDSFVSLNEKFVFSKVEKLTYYLLDAFNSHKFSEVNIVYTEYINSLTFNKVSKRLLPFNVDKKEEFVLMPPKLEPNANDLYKILLPLYLNSEVYHAILTSTVSEQAMRRNAMENATDNADEMLDKLQLEYNKARQSAITQEISEVVSGANGLN